MSVRTKTAMVCSIAAAASLRYGALNLSVGALTLGC